MTIRPFTKQDIETCASLYRDAYNGPPWNYNFSQEKAGRYLTEYADAPRFTGFVLIDGDHIAGVVLGHAKTWWTNDILYIDELFVDPATRGRGFGKKLLEYIGEHAADKGYEVITLMTNRHMPAFRFYDHLDYLQAEHFVFMFKPV